MVKRDDPTTWKKPTREPKRYENRAAIGLRQVAFKKVYNDKKFWYVDVEYRRVPLTRGSDGKLYNAVAIQKNVTPQTIEMQDNDQVTIVAVEEIPWNEW